MVLNISDKVMSQTLKDFQDFFNKKVAKKGTLSFNSGVEVLGKLTEEYHECIAEVHDKNWTKLESELFDVAVVALFGAMSLRVNKNI